jgi:mono/diheme cytochrome c family protein
MKPATVAAALATAAIPFVVLAQEAAPAHPAAPDAVASAIGQVVYQRYCGSCHGPTGRGDGPLAPELRTKVVDLTQLAAAHGGKFPFFKVVQVIDGRRMSKGHGSADMPVWGEIFPKTQGAEAPNPETAVARMTHYLWSIQEPPAPASFEPAPRK